MKEYYLGLWKAPLKFNGVDWISYDNEVSVQHKVAYMYSQGLGGVALASLNTDDVEGLCGNGKYPILRAVSQELQKVFGPR
ncbi:Chitinase-like protein Idgf4 [Halotydeus destructor]|nr:Chitinase-like protein Idgf4 [Halotydeus destructor]